MGDVLSQAEVNAILYDKEKEISNHLRTELAAKDETVKQLREALENYGVHEEDCDVWQSRYDIEDDVVECTCGLEDALTAGEGE